MKGHQDKMQRKDMEMTFEPNERTEIWSQYHRAIIPN